PGGCGRPARTRWSAGRPAPATARRQESTERSRILLAGYSIGAWSAIASRAAAVTLAPGICSCSWSLQEDRHSKGPRRQRYFLRARGLNAYPAPSVVSAL